MVSIAEYNNLAKLNQDQLMEIFSHADFKRKNVNDMNLLGFIEKYNEEKLRFNTEQLQSLKSLAQASKSANFNDHLAKWRKTIGTLVDETGGTFKSNKPKI